MGNERKHLCLAMKIKNAQRIGEQARATVLRARLSEWFGASGRDLPWRRTRDPYAIVVSEFMLQQTQVTTVIAYFERWMARFPDFGALAAATETDVLQVWQGLGYYSRARNLHRAAQQVVAQHGGQLPEDPEIIARLPGVGRYTAGAVACFAFDRAAPAVDANIARVLARLFNMREPIDSKSGSAKIWQLAAGLLPPKHGREHTSALMELGALVCVARKPRCAVCPVRELCAATDPELLPVKKPRPKTVEMAEDCVWIVENGAVLLEQQLGPRWRGLWKLPVLEGQVTAKPLVELEYPFTHHRVTLRVFPQLQPGAPGPAQRWFKIDQLDKAAFAAAHRRAVSALLLLECASPLAL